MRDSPASGLTYEVVTDELLQAAACVAAVTETARDAVVESLPTLAGSLGDPGLASCLTEFCARWDTGLSHLVGDSDEMADRLRRTASTYLRADCATVTLYDQLRTGSRPRRGEPFWRPDPTAVAGFGGR